MDFVIDGLALKGSSGAVVKEIGALIDFSAKKPKRVMLFSGQFLDLKRSSLAAKNARNG